MQGCCQMEVHSDLLLLPSQIATTASLLPILLIALVYPPVNGPMSSHAHLCGRHPLEHSPPGLLIATTTVLRI